MDPSACLCTATTSASSLSLLSGLVPPNRPKVNAGPLTRGPWLGCSDPPCSTSVTQLTSLLHRFSSDVSCCLGMLLETTLPPPPLVLFLPLPLVLLPAILIHRLTPVWKVDTSFFGGGSGGAVTFKPRLRHADPPTVQTLHAALVAIFKILA